MEKLLYTTLRLLQGNNVLDEVEYSILSSKMGENGEDKPVPPTSLLEINAAGWDAFFITIKSFRALPPEQFPRAEKILRLFNCDTAERVLPLFELQNPDDERCRKALEIARKYAYGKASADELNAAAGEAAEAIDDAYAAFHAARERFDRDILPEEEVVKFEAAAAKSRERLNRPSEDIAENCYKRHERHLQKFEAAWRSAEAAVAAIWGGGRSCDVDNYKAYAITAARTPEYAREAACAAAGDGVWVHYQNAKNQKGLKISSLTLDEERKWQSLRLGVLLTENSA